MYSIKAAINVLIEHPFRSYSKEVIKLYFKVATTILQKTKLNFAQTWNA